MTSFLDKPTMTKFYYLRNKNKHPRVTICLMAWEDEGGTVSYTRGVALCSDAEMPVKAVGRRIARSRAIKAHHHQGDGDYYNNSGLTYGLFWRRVVEPLGRRHGVYPCYKSRQVYVLTDLEKKLVEKKAETIKKRRPMLPARPVVVCLCGSTKFKEVFTRAQLEETLAGNIVLTIGCNMRSDKDIFGHLPPDEFARVKLRLDHLHFRKIEMADEVLILNVGGYIGLSTCDELNYARVLGKRVRFLEETEPCV